MRAGLVLRRSALLAALLPACMSVEEAEDYALEDEPGTDWRAGALVPDGERPRVASSSDDVEEAEPPAGGPPRIRVQFDAESCWPSFSATGFPAIDLETRRVVVPLAHVLQLSMLPGSLDLVWFDVDTGEEIARDTVLAADYGLLPEEEDVVDCSRPAAPIRRAVRDANSKLAAGSWIQMEPLPVELYEEIGDSDWAYRDEQRPRERPVQVLVQHGHAIARVLGVEVLERHDISNRMSMVHRVYAHRPSGTVLFGARDCEGDSCTCDPRSRAAVLHWQPETFAAIAAHPCVPEPRAESEAQDSCDLRPLPFEDADAPLWQL